ncbi:MAG: DUF4440 domain-containing protein [Gemmatimonadetes bacterium]|nr:DUF4440 domain-containing protein [Gemmatimonadota bacterium]
MPSRTIIAILLLMPAIAGRGWAQSTPELSAVRAAVDAGNACYIAAYAAADARALADVYDLRGARLGDNGVVVRGRAAITESVDNFLDRVGPVKVTIETVELWVVDDQAYETGKWSYTYTPSGESERTIGGRYVTTWKLQSDGGWKIFADMGVPGTSLEN